MLQYATVFLIIAVVAALFGVAAIMAGAVEVAEILFVVFVALFVGGLVFAMRNRGASWSARALDGDDRAHERAMGAGGHE